MARRYQSTSFQIVCVFPHDNLKALELGYREFEGGTLAVTCCKSNGKLATADEHCWYNIRVIGLSSGLLS